MIRVERKEGVVWIRFSTELPTEVKWFHNDCGNDEYAELLRRYLDARLDECIVAIRKQEYEKGYKAGKNKKAKQTWFSPLVKAE